MLERKSLVRRLKQGDQEALRRIYEKYKDNLLTIAVSLLHDIDAAEDILHDVFVSFAAGVEKLELRASLRNYLIISVVNRVRDRCRRKNCDVLELSNLRRIDSDSGDPQQSAIFGEESVLLTNALGRLPLEQRETIILHLNAGLTFKEIAEMQGVSINTVQGRYRYGIGKLRAIWNGQMKK